MTAAANPCPRCARPIADTGYVCHVCRRDLRARLRTAAAYIETGRFDDVAGRQTRTSLGVIEPKPVDRAVYAGPWCYGGGHDCGHDSCRLIWYSIITRRIEDPLPHESAGILNEGADEVRWIVENTARAWARFVHAERGTPIPIARPRPVESVSADEPRTKTGELVPWCIWGDLPFDQCGCGRPHQEEG